MNFKKYLMIGAAVAGLGMTSCVGDLDLKPNDPNLVDTSDPNFKANSLAMCYAGIACSGISGPGSSYVADLDPGTSAYLRLMFTLNEFCTDECIWIWPDAGVSDITACTWGANNGLLQGAYYRLMGHIAVCNQFLLNTKDDTDAETQEMRAEARVLRAYSYYNMMDLFGASSFCTEETNGQDPTQISRADLYKWVESELKDIVDNKLISENPVYGRVGLDGAEALLARLYLNGQVFSGENRYADCQKRCDNIIARHQGGGFEGSGLAEHWHYLFSLENKNYMPGGANKAENEILFGIAFDADMTQSYGGPTFIISSTISNTHYIPRQNYGSSSEWSCLRGCAEMAARFPGAPEETQDVRDDLWFKGVMPAGKDEAGNKWDAEDYSDRFVGFTGAWGTCGGNAIIKFTGRTANAAKDGGWNWNADGTPGWPVTTFSSTDQPIIRLADVYLMWAECYVNGQVGERQKALDYINLVRRRAGAPNTDSQSLTKQGIMDERSRELYLESTRRTDLVRNGMFAGPTQTIWQYKGSISNNAGTRIAAHMNLYPIPQAVLNSQPGFKQNPGY